MNANDATLTGLAIAQTGSRVGDTAPNAPVGAGHAPATGAARLPVGEHDPDLARGERHPPTGRGSESGAGIRVRPGPVRSPGLAVAQDQRGARPGALAYGGGLPYSRNREVRTVVCWITTVAGDRRPPSVVFAGVPSIATSQRPLFADQVKRNNAAG
jgi:hypothetical protein